MLADHLIQPHGHDVASGLNAAWRDHILTPCSARSSPDTKAKPHTPPPHDHATPQHSTPHVTQAPYPSPSALHSTPPCALSPPDYTTPNCTPVSILSPTPSPAPAHASLLRPHAVHEACAQVGQQRQVLHELAPRRQARARGPHRAVQLHLDVAVGLLDRQVGELLLLQDPGLGAAAEGRRGGQMEGPLVSRH